MTNKISIYVLCHNRVSFLQEVIDSIIRQRGVCFEIIISDNSGGGDVRDFIFSHYPELKYIKRHHQLKPTEHINKVLSEVVDDFFMIFHDDDIMLDNCIKRLEDALIKNDDVAAVAVNAYKLVDNSIGGLVFDGLNINENVRLSATDLIEMYLGAEFGSLPFPSYMYRKSIMSGIRLNLAEGGKHSDVSFLVKVAEKSSVMWIMQPFMLYRYHAGQDSATESIADRLSLLRFLRRYLNPSRRRYLCDQYRYMFWRRWLSDVENSGMQFKYFFRYLIVKRFIINFPLIHPIYTFKAIKRRISRLCGI